MKKIKRFKIVEALGSGGMGTVYKAYDPLLERAVAIKLMHPHLLKNNTSAERIIREAQAAGKVTHPNIVTIYEVGKVRGSWYIVMEYVEGITPAECLDPNTFMPQSMVFNLMSQLLTGLDVLHCQGTFHRDIKSDNLLITDDDTLKILDFGIARMRNQQRLTHEDVVVGTAHYMAPEQILDEEIDYRCDIYAAGVLLYQLLTNRLPFNGNNEVAVLYKHLNDAPVPPSYYNPEISKRLDAIVLLALQKKKEARWKSVTQFSQALKKTLKQDLRATGKIPLESPVKVALANVEESLTVENSFGQLTPGFIGRETEFQGLIASFDTIMRHQGKSLIISGEAGVGKTALANRLKEYALQQNAFVLYGASLYQEGMDVYLPFVDAFRKFFNSDIFALNVEDRNRVKRLVWEKAPLLWELTEPFSTNFGKEEIAATTEEASKDINHSSGFFWLLAVISCMRPVILVIDDLQWADESSLQLFHFLSRQIDRSRIMMVGIVRSDRFELKKDRNPGKISDVWTRMRREDNYQEIELKRLSLEDTRQLIDKMLGNTLFSEKFYSIVYRETQGNSLFLIETVKILQEKGDIYRQNDAWYDKPEGFDFSVPRRIEDVFLRQLSALNDGERELLQVASIIGIQFDISLLCAIMEMKKIKMLKMLQHIESNFQLLTSTEDGFKFEHPLLRDSLYHEIPVALRKEYHLMIAAEYEKTFGKELGALVGVVAAHFRKGGDHRNAIPLLYQAGLRATKIAAYREGLRYFGDLSDSVEKSAHPIPEEISERLIQLNNGICHEELGSWEQSLECYQELHGIYAQENNLDGQVDTLRRIGRIYDKQGEWDQALSVYEQCINIMQQNDLKNVGSRIYNNIGIIYFQQGDFDKAKQYFNLTLESIDSNTGEFDKAHALTNMGIIFNIQSDFQTALENYHQALDIYNQKNDHKYEARVYHNIGMTYSDIQEWDNAIDAFELCLKLASDVEDNQLIAMTQLNMGKVYARQGEISKAKKFTHKSFKIFSRIGDQLSLAEVYHVWGIVSSHEGDFSRAEEFFQSSIRINKELKYYEGLAENYISCGTMFRNCKKVKQAREYYDKAKEMFLNLKLDAKLKEVTRAIAEIS